MEAIFMRLRALLSLLFCTDYQESRRHSALYTIARFSYGLRNSLFIDVLAAYIGAVFIQFDFTPSTLRIASVTAIAQ